MFLKHKGKDVIVHEKIYHHFGESCIDKIAKNQTIILSKQS